MQAVVKRWIRWMFFIRKGWLSVFWEWVILLHLVEKAQEQFDEEQAKKLESKIRKNKFDFADFKQQLEQIKKMGNMKDLMGMIPGVGKQIKDIDISDDSFKGIEAMINSMTPAERSRSRSDRQQPEKKNCKRKRERYQ